MEKFKLSSALAAERVNTHFITTNPHLIMTNPVFPVLGIFLRLDGQMTYPISLKESRPFLLNLYKVKVDTALIHRMLGFS